MISSIARSISIISGIAISIAMSSMIAISIAIECKEQYKPYMIIYLVGHIFFRDPYVYIGCVLTGWGLVGSRAS